MSQTFAVGLHHIFYTTFTFGLYTVRSSERRDRTLVLLNISGIKYLKLKNTLVAFL